MKKFLFTCFLGYLYLYGSESLSKVVQSPPEDLLHRSDLPAGIPAPGFPVSVLEAGSDVSPHSGDTHRGGAILSDTFDYHSSGMETSVISNSVGLEYPSQFDMTAASLLGAPRSDDSGHPTTQLSLEPSGVEASVSSCPPTRIAHRSSDIGHPTYSFSQGLSLVDNSTSQGQEEGNTPAQVGKRVVADSLGIGDQIPAGLEFESLLNFDGGALRLDDYLGKYLILQFWAPTCSASLGFLPQADALTEKYGDRLQILPVTTFPKEKIQPVLESYQALRYIGLPLVVNAQDLRDYFPHTIIPHFVVLDPKGKVIAITGMEDMTEANLEKLIDQKTPDFRRKIDNRIELPVKEKLISGSPQVLNKNIRYQSALTNYIPGVGGSLIQNKDDLTHIRIVNLNLFYHYQLAYSENNIDDYFGLNRIETSGFGEEELTTSKMGLDYTGWMEEGNHVFGYELIAPPNVNPYELMRQDLRRYFPEIEAVVEVKPKMVYALIQQEGKRFPESQNSKRAYKTGINGVEMTNYPLQGFVYHLNAAFLSSSPYPVINLTGIEHPVDLTLRAKLTDVHSLKEALNSNGLDLILREEKIPVLVMKKITTSNLLHP